MIKAWKTARLRSLPTLLVASPNSPPWPSNGSGDPRGTELVQAHFHLLAAETIETENLHHFCDQEAGSLLSTISKAWPLPQISGCSAAWLGDFAQVSCEESLLQFLQLTSVPGKAHLGSLSFDLPVASQVGGESMNEAIDVIIGNETRNHVGPDFTPCPTLSLRLLAEPIEHVVVEVLTLPWLGDSW